MKKLPAIIRLASLIIGEVANCSNPITQALNEVRLKVPEIINFQDETNILYDERTFLTGNIFFV